MEEKEQQVGKTYWTCCGIAGAASVVSGGAGFGLGWWCKGESAKKAAGTAVEGTEAGNAPKGGEARNASPDGEDDDQDQPRKGEDS